jgi:hypothetical protein
MTRHALLAAGLSSVFSVAVFAGDTTPRPCCAARSRAQASQSAKTGQLRCALTGKVVSECCCRKREGKLHCTLADKDVDHCCCQPVTSKAAKAAVPKA